MKRSLCVGIIVLIVLWPAVSMAGPTADNIKSLNEVLTKLYTDMSPLFKGLVNVGRGIAGFAALFYIGTRVAKHIMNAEPVDFYPLFRPFVLGFCIAFFPLTMDLINGILKPMETGTEKMVYNSDKTVAALLKEKERKIRETDKWKMYVGIGGKGDKDAWYKYTYDKDPATEGMFEGIGNDLLFAAEKQEYKFKQSVKAWMSEVLQVVFQAAALCINTLRTFQMIVLGIIGPLVFGMAVFDGFQHTLTNWISRYINVFLWLPVANIFGSIIGKVQENMLKIDLSQMAAYGDTFFSQADTGYLIFMLIGIVGYFTVPSVSNFIVNAGGGNAMLQKITSMTSQATPMSIARGSIDAKKSYDDGRKYDAGSGVWGAIGRMDGGGKGGGAYQHSKVSGKS